MAVISAESAAITKSRLAKGFNGDNLNINGRAITTENADAGFKAAGAVKPPYVAVMASGNQKGFAAGAASAFNDYIKDLKLDPYNAESILNKFFDDMDAVVEKCGIESSSLSLGIVCVYEDCVVAAKSGDCHLLRFSDGELFEIALSDDDGGRGFQFIDMITDGDMFALIGEECSRDLDYDGIVKAFDSGNDLKLMIRDFFTVIAANAKGKDCSLVLIRLQCDTERTFAAVPTDGEHDEMYSHETVEEFAEDADPSDFLAEPPIDPSELGEEESVVSDTENPQTGKKPSAKKKVLSFIPIAVLVIILAVAAALYLATRPSNPFKESESVSGNDAAFVMGDSQSDVTGDFNGSNGMQAVEDTEYGGNAASSLTSTTNAPTQQQTENTTRYTPPETTTSAPTTEAPVQPDPDPETTTVAPDPEPEPEPEPDPEPEPQPEPEPEPQPEPEPEPQPEEPQGGEEA